mmetsp:Transcript_4876/g.5711  ORF Transcript_4876/g.5711 Transcript_4876/m.5711 type:complete len:238 (-) Transcript_4876:2278-2991(-)
MIRGRSNDCPLWEEGFEPWSRDELYRDLWTGVCRRNWTFLVGTQLNQVTLNVPRNDIQRGGLILAGDLARAAIRRCQSATLNVNLTRDNINILNRHCIIRNRIPISILDQHMVLTNIRDLVPRDQNNEAVEHRGFNPVVVAGTSDLNRSSLLRGLIRCQYNREGYIRSEIIVPFNVSGLDHKVDVLASFLNIWVWSLQCRLLRGEGPVLHLDLEHITAHEVLFAFQEHIQTELQNRI